MKKRKLMEFYRVLANIICHVFIRLKVYDVEKLIPEGGGMIASNHKSMLDMIMIGVKAPRYLNWMAKKELFKNKLFGKFIRSCGAFPVDRGCADVGAAKTALHILQQGELVGIFPEGTRHKDATKPGKAHAGVAKFAIEAGVPVQPVAVWGKYRLFGKVYVRFGDPYYLPKNDPEHPFTKADYMEFSREILEKCYALMEVEDGNN